MIKMLRICLLIGLLVGIGANPGRSSARTPAAVPASPACDFHAHVSYSLDVIYIYACAVGDTVSVQVKDAGSTIVFDQLLITAGYNLIALLEFGAYGFDLLPGMTVEFQDLTASISSAVLIEAFTGSSNEAAYLISGTAPIGRLVTLQIDPVDAAPTLVQVNASDTGYWEYSLGTLTLEAWEGYLNDGFGNAVLADKGELPLFPELYIELNHDLIQARYFVPSSNIRIEIFEASDLLNPVLSLESATDTGGNLFVFAGGYGIDLLPGMALLVTNYDAYPGLLYFRSKQLEIVAINDFDALTNHVQGQATPGRTIQVLGFSGSLDELHQVIAGGDGSWQVDFTPGFIIDRIIVFSVDANANICAFNLREGEWVSLVDSSGEVLVSTDEAGNHTIVTVQPGAVGDPISLGYTINTTPPGLPLGYAFVGQNFSLTASQLGILLPDYAFLLPVIIHLEYQDEALLNLDEGSLSLYRWDPDLAAWVDAAATCDPAYPYTRNLAENYLEVAICHLSDFSLVGRYQFKIFTPLMLKADSR